MCCRVIGDLEKTYYGYYIKIKNKLIYGKMNSKESLEKKDTNESNIEPEMF